MICSKHLVCLVAAVYALTCVTQAVAQTATLTVDVRAVSASGGTVLDPKHVLLTGGVGSSVNMDVYFIITGQTNNDPFDDLMHYLWGSFLSSNGGLRGDLTDHLEFNYIDTLGFDGVRQDLDGDGDIDIGSNSPSSGNDYFRAYAGENSQITSVDKIATLTWLQTEASQQTLINFRPFLGRLGAQWYVDGFVYNPTTGAFVSGDPVAIMSVPEPTNSSVLLGLVGLGGRGCRSCKRVKRPGIGGRAWGASVESG